MNTIQYTNIPQRVVQACTRSYVKNSRNVTNTSPYRTFTTSRTRDDTTDQFASRPRWQQTPKAMAMPIRVRSRGTDPAFRVNDKPEILDQAYTRMLGKGGDAMLPEEVKWLAVTHKSFDHGRRGSNDRLAFLGMSDPLAECTFRNLWQKEQDA